MVSSAMNNCGDEGTLQAANIKILKTASIDNTLSLKDTYFMNGLPHLNLTF
jgi:hypothetical protein